MQPAHYFPSTLRNITNLPITFRMPKLLLFKQKSRYIIFFRRVKVACISGLRAVGRREIMKWLFEIGGCSHNVSRGFCRKTSFEAYPFAAPVDEWSSFYQSKKLFV